MEDCILWLFTFESQKGGFDLGTDPSPLAQDDTVVDGSCNILFVHCLNEAIKAENPEGAEKFASALWKSQWYLDEILPLIRGDLRKPEKKPAKPTKK